MMMMNGASKHLLSILWVLWEGIVIAQVIWNGNGIHCDVVAGSLKIHIKSTFWKGVFIALAGFGMWPRMCHALYVFVIKNEITSENLKKMKNRPYILKGRNPVSSNLGVSRDLTEIHFFFWILLTVKITGIFSLE